MIEIEGLTKQYGKFTAVNDLSTSVRKGEVYGLLGPNGSGKTTTIRMLVGMLRPTAGRATIGGYDCWTDSRRVREIVSYLPGELRQYGAMSGFSTLKFLSDLRGGGCLDRALAIAEEIMKLDLSRKVSAYSTGMKQKLALAQVFADPVDVLLLDEPTSALDPSARNDVLGLVRAAKNRGQTVVFSGHVLSEVEKVSDRVAIMRGGHLMHIEDMHTRRAQRMVLLRFGPGFMNDVPDELQLHVRERNGENWLFEHQGTVETLLAWLSMQDVTEIAIGTEDLHSLYNQFHGSDAVLAAETAS